MDKKVNYCMGSANPLATHSFSGVDGQLFEITATGTKKRLHFVQGLSFEGTVSAYPHNKNVIVYEDVSLNLAYVLRDDHKEPHWNSTFILELNEEHGHRLTITFQGFSSIRCGFGISIDDIISNITYTLKGGMAELTRPGAENEITA